MSLDLATIFMHVQWQIKILLFEINRLFSMSIAHAGNTQCIVTMLLAHVEVRALALREAE